MSQIDSEYEAMVTSVPILTQVDFSSIQEPRLDYMEQEEIDPMRFIKHTATAAHYGLDLGRAVCLMGHKYMGAHQDIDAMEKECSPHMDPGDMAHIIRILSKSCTAQLKLPREHKMRMIIRGKKSSDLDNINEVVATMNKDKKLSHTVPFLSWIYCFCSTAQYVPQRMILALDKDPRIVWDESTTLLPDDIAMNQIVPMKKEADITFVRSKEGYVTHIYNTRVSYPHADIDLSSADIKGAH